MAASHPDRNPAADTHVFARLLSACREMKNSTLYSKHTSIPWTFSSPLKELSSRQHFYCVLSTMEPSRRWMLVALYLIELYKYYALCVAMLVR